MYSSGDMEISCGQPFTITGRVHCNGQLYIEPDGPPYLPVCGHLSRRYHVSAAVRMIVVEHLWVPLFMKRRPRRTCPRSLWPIGATNTPAAVREIIEPPPSGEDSELANGQAAIL